jgi:glyoxalase family protein
MKIELISAQDVSPERAYTSGPVPLEHAIHGFHSATLSEEGYQKTAALLTDTLGFKLMRQDGNRFRYAVASGVPGAVVDVLCAPEEPTGRVAAGTVHHIAWRTRDDDQQGEWLDEIGRLGYNVSPVMDRKYFHSIYFREPGNILFEIATDPPGFTVDEPLEQLGSKLVLPPWLERTRAQLEAALPPLRLPTSKQAVS